MAEDVKITTEIDFERLVLGLDRVDTKLDELAATAKKSDGGFSSFQRSILTANSAIGIFSAGIATLRSGFSSLGQALDLGSEVIAVQSAFDGFVASGKLSSDTLEGLQAATRGTVDNLTLLKEANKAVVLGLPTEGFEEAAAAAIKLGRAQGVDALGSIQALTEGVGKGSIEILNNIGVVVKAEEAQKKFAEANAIVGRELTENERKLAFQQEAYRQITQGAGELADVQLNAADAFNGVTASISNSFQTFSRSITENQELAKALEDLKKELDGVDTQQAVAALGELAVIAVKTTTSIASLFDTLAGSDEDFNRGARVIIDTVKNVFDSRIEFGQAYQVALVQERERVEDLANTNARMAQETQRLKEIEETIAETRKKKTEATDDDTDSTDRNTKAMEKAKREAEKAREALERLSEKTIDQVFASERYEKILEKVKSGELTRADATKQASDIITQLIGVNKDLEKAQDDVNKAVADFNSGIGDTTAIEKALTKRDELIKQQEDLTGATKKKGKFSILDGIFGEGTGDFAEAIIGDISAASDNIGESISNAVITGIDKAFGDPQLTQALQGINTEVISRLGESSEDSKLAAREAGKAVLRYWTAGFSDLIPDSFYEEYEKNSPLVKALFGEAAGTTARKAADKFIAEALDGDRLAIVIDGELRKIGDLNFSDNLSGLTGVYTELDAETRAAFDNIGFAASQVFGTTTELGINFASVLANNLGGSLNNVQLLFKQLGLSAEQLQDEVVKAFLSADISATEALSTLQSIEDITADGIPGAVGDTDQAFQNLIDSAGRGIAFVDALGDIGAEALERNVGSLDQLRDELKASGKFSAEEVDKLFNAIAESGITSLEQLRDVSDITAINIAAALEGSQFSFDPLREEIDSISDAINSIPTKKDISVNLKVNGSSEDKDIFRGLATGGSSFQPRSNGGG